MSDDFVTTNDWIQTASGSQLHPIDPHVDEIKLEDIAHHLTNICRFTGATKRHYSVAQHSIYVYKLVKRAYDDLYRTWPTPLPESAYFQGLLGALLHDAPEYGLNDLSRPLKYQPELEGYREVEASFHKVVAWAFGIEPEYLASPLVSRMDKAMLYAERVALMPKPPHKWHWDGEDMGIKVRWWPQWFVKWYFLRLARKLIKRLEAARSLENER